MGFEKGDIVSHIGALDKFYIIIDCYSSNQYLVEDYEKTQFSGQYLFMGDYLLTRTGRRDHVLENILKK